MIEIKNVTKKFGDAVVLQDISLKLETGKIYGFIGRNGSGKTMLMKHICGFVKPTSGEVWVNGVLLGKYSEIPDDLGMIIENPGFLPEYSGFRNLKMLSMINGKIGDGQIRETMRMVGLNPAEKKRVGKYSLGMRQRLGIAQAIMENPKILLLDEPMNGLDDEGVKDIRKLLISLKEQGKLIIIASHSREDIELLCDCVYRMEKGRMREECGY